MRKAGVPGETLRCTLNTFAPGPLIVSHLSINNSPLVRLISPLTFAAKVIVLPAQTLAMTARSESVPLSLLLLTIRLAVLQGKNSACTS
jgi:hypothetical protein